MCAQRVIEKKTIFFNVRLEPSLHRELSVLAQKNDRTVAAEMRVAIRRYLEQEREAA
ncbi:MAG TPA: ribbon-helix-helix protein, CopG family [Gaiellaceae bacterium]|nr:ribbon-helix-helix protein, CopG family [Gaiellaceae bacterium]